MFREEMQVLGLPGAEDVTDGKVHRKRVRLHAAL